MTLESDTRQILISIREKETGRRRRGRQGETGREGERDREGGERDKERASEGQVENCGSEMEQFELVAASISFHRLTKQPFYPIQNSVSYCARCCPSLSVSHSNIREQSVSP